MSIQSELEIPKALGRLGQDVERHVAGLAKDCGRLVMEFAGECEIPVQTETWEQPGSLTCGSSVSLWASQVPLGKRTVMPSANVTAGFLYMMRPGGTFADVDVEAPDVCHIVVSGQPTEGWASDVVVALNTAGRTEGSVVRNRDHKNVLPSVVPEIGAWGEPKANVGYACALRLATAHAGAKIVWAVARQGGHTGQVYRLEDTLRAGTPLLRRCIGLAGESHVDFLDENVTVKNLLESPFVRPPKSKS